MTKRVALTAALLLALGAAACQKGKRTLHESAPMSSLPRSIAVGKLEAGPKSPPVGMANPYEDNAYAMTEGQRLYNWYNCNGCHFRGGGGIGPALMDEVWIYGKEPGNIFSTIVEGRPNGMPSWRGKIPEYQIWQIVTYIQTMKAERSIAAAPGPRQEHLQAGEGRTSR